MKTLLSLTAATLLILPAAAFGAPPAPVQTPSQAPAKAVQAPAQAPVQAPAKTALAPTAQGYRTYSYQPGTAPMSYGYGYQPGYRQPSFFSGFQPADYKVKGQFWAR
jgi:hypothetical protein